MAGHARPALTSLQRQWLLAAGAAVASLLAGYQLLSRSTWQPNSVRWVLLAGIGSAAVLALLWVVLPHNHRPHEAELLPTLGLATWLTFLSGLLIAWLAGFLLSPWPAGALAWAPAFLYLASRIVDLFDGAVARATGRVTRAGAILDIEFDGLGLLVAVLVAVQYGQLPPWYLPLAVSRQLFVAGMWWRTRTGRPVYDLPPSDNRRITAGCQTGFVAAVLCPILAPPATTLAAAVFAIPLLASFGRDWLVVSGAIDAGSPQYARFRNVTKSIVEGWMPLGARLAGTTLATLLLVHAAPNFTSWELTFYGYGLDNVRTTATVVAVVFAAALPLYAAGIAGRTAAILVIAVAVLDIQASGLLWRSNAVLLICGIIVFHFGSGYYSLWQPEEVFLHTRLGEEGADPG